MRLQGVRTCPCRAILIRLRRDGITKVHLCRYVTRLQYWPVELPAYRLAEARDAQDRRLELSSCCLSRLWRGRPQLDFSLLVPSFVEVTQTAVGAPRAMRASTRHRHRALSRVRSGPKRQGGQVSAMPRHSIAVLVSHGPRHLVFVLVNVVKLSARFGRRGQTPRRKRNAGAGMDYDEAREKWQNWCLACSGIAIGGRMQEVECKAHMNVNRSLCNH